MVVSARQGQTGPPLTSLQSRGVQRSIVTGDSATLWTSTADNHHNHYCFPYANIAEILSRFSGNKMDSTLPRTDFELAKALVTMDCFTPIDVVQCMNALLEDQQGSSDRLAVQFGKWLDLFRVEKVLKLSDALRLGEKYLCQEVTMLREQLESKRITGERVLELIHQGNFGLAELFHRTLHGILLWDQTDGAWRLVESPSKVVPEYVVMAELMEVLGRRAKAVGTDKVAKLTSTLWSATAAEHGLFLARAFSAAPLGPDKPKTLEL